MVQFNNKSFRDTIETIDNFFNSGVGRKFFLFAINYYLHGIYYVNTVKCKLKSPFVNLWEAPELQDSSSVVKRFFGLAASYEMNVVVERLIFLAKEPMTSGA